MKMFNVNLNDPEPTKKTCVAIFLVHLIKIAFECVCVFLMCLIGLFILGSFGHFAYNHPIIAVAIVIAGWWLANGDIDGNGDI